MSEKTTPMMQQWHACKAKSKNALVLFRLGDFYEAFYEDAKLLARDLELTLTQRQGIPMSGIPAHAVEGYLDKLISKGHLVAIAEQIENPQDVKGLVKRDIVRLLSPATVLNPSFLSEKTCNFFACIYKLNSRYALALIDISTADFKVVECELLEELKEELLRQQPKEILISQKLYEDQESLFKELELVLKFRMTIKPEVHFNHQLCMDTLTRLLNVHSLDGLGLKGAISAINAAGALVSHLQEDLSLNLHHIRHLETYHLGCYMHIDPTTLRHLEILEPAISSIKTPTLLSTMDKTSTPMGGRLFHRWMCQPLIEPQDIHDRQSAVEALAFSEYFHPLHEKLQHIRDIQRLLTRIATHYLSPKDIQALKLSLIPLEPIKQYLENFTLPLLVALHADIPDFSTLINTIAITLVEDPPVRSTDTPLIKEGVSEELDALRKLKKNQHQFLSAYQEKIKTETGIKTLKISYNNAFGYYIEVTRAQSQHMPSSFYKKQTLVNCERFITDELRTFEYQILHAEGKIAELEARLFLQLKNHILEKEALLLQASKAIAYLDCLMSLALLARKKGYVKPLIDTSDILKIDAGRHPVIESFDFHHHFIPNDVNLHLPEAQLILLTGPNMAGKSTYIRQVALITLMAHMGSFVPAEKAHIGIVDKIFSRIGASDDLSRGQSTFMVEMSETANILHHATNRSLVILDEIGRGTSTYDGISIAWAIVEYLVTQEGKKAKTLFATHYSELIDLENKLNGVKNFHVAVEETPKGMTFLRKILPGGTDKSYGIHVAKLAGIPHIAIQKAYQILSLLENTEQYLQKKKIKKKPITSEPQFDLFPPLEECPHEKLFEELKSIDLDKTSPIEALLFLQKCKNKFII